MPGSYGREARPGALGTGMGAPTCGRIGGAAGGADAGGAVTIRLDIPKEGRETAAGAAGDCMRGAPIGGAAGAFGSAENERRCRPESGEPPQARGAAYAGA